MKNLAGIALALLALASLTGACGSASDDTPAAPWGGSGVTAGTGNRAGGAGQASGGSGAIAGSANTAGGGAGGATAGASSVGGGSNTAGAGGSSGALSAGGASAGGGGAQAGAPQGGSAGTGTTGPMTEVWVAPDGKDSNAGTVDAPMLTVCDTSLKVGACYKLCPGSYGCPAKGGTIWMKGGTYKITKKIDIGATRPGVAAGVMKLWAVAGTKPIIDASGLDKAEPSKTGIAIHLKGSYWHIKGIEILNAPHNCVKVEGGYNTIESLVVHHCANTGITLSHYDGTDMSAGPGTNNTVLNCDSYGNVGLDGGGEDADGFGAKEQTGANNLFKGCRAWNNADDGFDFYGWGNPIKVENSWAFENAKMKAPGGDGNGFKLGNGPGGHTITNAISAYNVKTAYTSNGASKLSTCMNCKACSNGSVTGSGDHGISGTIATLSPCPDLKKAEGARNADGSLPTL